MNINAIRQQFRQHRKVLSSADQNQNSFLLTQHLNLLLAYSRPLKIGCYVAMKGEISLNPWITGGHRHLVYLPKLYDVIEPKLRFAALGEKTRWKLNRYGIPEPDCRWGKTLHARQLDAVLVPLVAFDRRGYRLGMGGGYYDRSLAFRHYRKKWLKPRLIGVAHSCQEHPDLPRQPWDVPLDCIITEQEIIVPEG